MPNSSNTFCCMVRARFTMSLVVALSEFLAEIEMSLGGLIAEKLIYGESSSGTRNDLENATNIARAMVCEYGMSKLGFAAVSKEMQIAMQVEIDQEVNAIITGCYDRCN